MTNRFIIFISDLHLTSWQDDTSIDILKILKDLLTYNKSFTLVLLGDIFNLAENDNIDGILDFHSELLNILKRLIQEKNVIYIRGNHDNDKEKLNKIFESLNINLEILDNLIIDNMYICHGHEFDFFCKDFVGKITERVSKWYEILEKRINIKNDYNLINSYNSIIINKAKEFCKKNKYDKIVLGHTHEHFITEKIINTGCCVNNRIDIIFYDTQKKHFKYLNFGGFQDEKNN